MFRRNPKILKIIVGCAILFFSTVATFFFINSDSNQIENKIDIDSIINKCDKTRQSSLIDSSEYCYSSEFKKISAKYGSVFAFKKLDELKRIDQSANGCHWIAHGIGTGEYLKDPNNWRQNLTKINQTCNYGAQHGMVEAYISTIPEGKLTPEIIPTICGSSPLNDCNHIVGHIVLVTYLGDIDKSIDACKTFTDSLQNHYCNQGVFMENITALNLIDHKIVSDKYLDWASRVQDIKNICKKYSDPIAMACWEEITHALVVKHSMNPAKIFEICDEAPSNIGRDKCKTHTIGILAAQYNFNYERIANICIIPQHLDLEFEQNCYANIAGSTLSTAPEKLSQTVDFCDGLENNNFASKCFAMIYTMSNSGLYSKDSIKKTCAEKNRKYGELCLVDNGGVQTINISD